MALVLFGAVETGVQGGIYPISSFIDFKEAKRKYW